MKGGKKKLKNPYTFFDTYFEPCLKILGHFRFFRFFFQILATIFKKIIAFETNKTILKFCNGAKFRPPKKKHAVTDIL